LSDFEKAQFDALSNPEKIYLDKILAEDYNQAIAYMQENARQKEFMEAQRQKMIQIKDLE